MVARRSFPSLLILMHTEVRVASFAETAEAKVNTDKIVQKNVNFKHIAVLQFNTSTRC
jgi:hypothetical protein